MCAYGILPERKFRSFSLKILQQVLSGKFNYLCSSSLSVHPRDQKESWNRRKTDQFFKFNNSLVIQVSSLVIRAYNMFNKLFTTCLALVSPSILGKELHSKEASNVKDEAPVTNVSMLELPLPILIDIFSRLPIKTIVRLKCVCKTWFGLFSDPHFVKLHLARAPVSIMVLSNDWQIRIYSDSLVPLLKLKLNQIRNFPEERLSLLTSCNGLVCVHKFSYRKDEVFICNPILGEYMALPPLRSKRVERRIRGFGFTQIISQYKVLQTLNYKDQALLSNKLQVEIHTLGTDTWRHIGDLPYKLIHPYYGALLNGAFYWYAHSHDDKAAFMCSFDLGSEQFKPFPGPPIQDCGQCRPINSISVGVSGGFLYLCDGLLEPNIDIWVMKKHGMEKSWTKEFTVVNPLICKLQRIYGSMNILNYGTSSSREATEVSETVMLIGSQDLLAYNIKSKGVRKLKHFGIQSNYQAIPYTASLVSLESCDEMK